MLNRDYVARLPEWEDYDAWWDAAQRAGIAPRQQTLLPEPWESQMRETWNRVLDVEGLQDRTIQATFERLDLSEVTEITEFTCRRSSNALW